MHKALKRLWSTEFKNIVWRRGNLKETGDCKVVSGVKVARQHKVTVCWDKYENQEQGASEGRGNN